jgi:hypothetical protein
MGVVICNKHGRSGIAFACEHLVNPVERPAPLPHSMLFEYGLAGSEDLGYVIAALLCDACVANHQPPESGSFLADPFEEIDKFAQPTCANCLRERTSS